MFKSKRRSTEEIWEGEQIPGVTDIVRFAPSACNSQPWLVKNNGKLSVYRYKKPGKRGIMPANKVSFYTRIDIGVFICFLDICFEHNGIGFEKGLSHWRTFLKEDGMIAVTCPSWLTSVHPEEAEKFWTDAGSKLDLIEDNIKIMQDCGYQFVVAFALTEDCWTKNYFEPREQAINELIEKYNNCNTVKEYAELNRCEAELYRKYKQHYGYVFYIGRNTDNSNLRGGLL